MLAIGLLALMLLLAVVERYVYEEHSDGQIRVSLSFAPDRLGRGESGELLVRVEHVGRLPIPWITYYLELPADLACPAARSSVLEGRLAVPYRGGIVRHYPITPEMRGLYRIERAIRVEFSDPLGLLVRRVEAQSPSELLVYPWPRSAAVVAPTRALMGSVERAALLEDPTATRGVRPYAPGDSLRRIHWPQTARTGSMMSRDYATAVDAQVYVVANLATHSPHWSNIDHDRLEAVVEVVAGLAIAACGLALPVGLMVNGVAFEATAITRIGPSASPRHLARYLEVLARLAAYPAESPETLLRAAAALPPEASLVLVTSTLPDAWRVALPALARSRPIVLVVVASADDVPYAPPGVSVLRMPIVQDRAEVSSS